MAFNLKNRSFLTLRDYSPREIAFLLKLAADLKTAKDNYDAAVTEVETAQKSFEDLMFALADQKKTDGKTAAGAALDLADQEVGERLARVFEVTHAFAHGVAEKKKAHGGFPGQMSAP